MGLKDNWYANEDGVRRWAKSPATLFLSMPRARPVTLQITPEAIYEPGSDQVPGDHGVLVVAVDGAPVATEAINSGETTAIPLNLPAGVHTVTLTLEAGNFRPSDAGGSDTRLLSFSIQSINLSLAD